jgi:IMP dehydrogenase/GMP reductase
MHTEELKLDFDDVLIRPKRSKVPSRSHIELERTYTFKNSGKEWTGLPIIAANMDTTGTFAMAQALAEYKMLTALHKHYSIEELTDFFADNQNIWDNVFYTVGIGDDDFEKLKEVAVALYVKINDFDTSNQPPMWRTRCYKEMKKTFPRMLCIDVANGYTEYFLERVEKIRKEFPNSTIMAGNVVTYEMAEQLILSGVDIVKCGIGSGSVCTTRIKTGCFVAGTKVNTKKGLINIEDIKVGNYVLTHDGTYQKVKKNNRLKEKEDLLEINGVICTKDHEFYVIDKNKADLVNENNLHNFAYWVEAVNLTDHHFLIEIEE